MVDLIDRQKIKAKFEPWLEVDGYSVGELNMLKAVLYEITVMPSVEAEPVRQTAEWIYGEKDGADGWYCSKCGFHIPWYYEYYGLNNINFIRDFHTCPHCDSKMMKYTGMDEVTQ